MTKPSHSGNAEWYENVASAQGGYVKGWSSEVEGFSGETAFTERLISLLTPTMTVLDAGCGSGEFTLAVAPKVRKIVGFDYAKGMIEAATTNARRTAATNATFIHASSRDLDAEPASFDLIYCRRGPTSILLRTDLLKPGGWLLGVHSHRQELVSERLAASGLQDIRIDEYETTERFPSLEDLARYLSRIPGNPDYLAPAQGAALRAAAEAYREGDTYLVPHYRYVWQGRQQP